MTKKFCAIFLTVLLAASLFGASPKSVGLTTSDIDALIDNWSEIDTLLDEQLNIETDLDSENMNLSQIMAMIPANVNKNVSKELNKLGISGSNALEKVFTITYGVAYSYMKSFFDLIALFATEDDDSMDEINAMLDVYASSVSDADLEVINTRLDDLSVLMGFTEDTSSSDDYDWGDYDWDDYDYGDDYDYSDWDDYDSVWEDYDDYDWSDYDWGDYDWDDYDYGDDYDWSDYDWGDYDWDDYEDEYFTEEQELDSETGVKFLKELIPSLTPKSGMSDFLYKTIKPGTYTKVKETDETAFMFQKDWEGSKYPRLMVSEFCISMSYEDADDPDADWYGEVNKYVDISGTTELYKATIRGTVYYERVIKTKEYGTIRIWIDTTNLGEGEDIYYSSEVYAVLSIGDYIIEGTAIVAAG